MHCPLIYTATITWKGSCGIFILILILTRVCFGICCSDEFVWTDWFQKRPNPRPIPAEEKQNNGANTHTPTHENKIKQRKKKAWQLVCLCWCLYVQYGWLLKDGSLEVRWMSQPAIPPAVTEFIKCGCKTGCAGNKCTCHRNSLKCTELCACVGCVNVQSVEEDIDNPPSDSDSETDFEGEMDYHGDSDSDW